MLVLNRDSYVTVYCHPVNLKAALAAVAEKQRAKVTLFLSPGWPACAALNEERSDVTQPNGSS